MNEGLSMATVIFLTGILLAARLIAMKLQRDPIANNHKPGTPEYEGYLKVIRQPRFTILMLLAILLTILGIVYGAFIIHSLVKDNTHTARTIIIVSPLVVVAFYIAGLITSYYLLVKNGGKVRPSVRSTRKYK